MAMPHPKVWTDEVDLNNENLWSEWYNEFEKWLLDNLKDQEPLMQHARENMARELGDTFNFDRDELMESQPGVVAWQYPGSDTLIQKPTGPEEVDTYGGDGELTWGEGIQALIDAGVEQVARTGLGLQYSKGFFAVRVGFANRESSDIPPYLRNRNIDDVGLHKTFSVSTDSTSDNRLPRDFWGDKIDPENAPTGSASISYSSKRFAIEDGGWVKARTVTVDINIDITPEQRQKLLGKLNKDDEQLKKLLDNGSLSIPIYSDKAVVPQRDPTIAETVDPKIIDQEVDFNALVRLNNKIGSIDRNSVFPDNPLKVGPFIGAKAAKWLIPEEADIPWDELPLFEDQPDDPKHDKQSYFPAPGELNFDGQVSGKRVAGNLDKLFGLGVFGEGTADSRPFFAETLITDTFTVDDATWNSVQLTADIQDSTLGFGFTSPDLFKGTPAGKFMDDSYGREGEVQFSFTDGDLGLTEGETLSSQELANILEGVKDLNGKISIKEEDDFKPYVTYENTVGNLLPGLYSLTDESKVLYGGRLVGNALKAFDNDAQLSVETALANSLGFIDEGAGEIGGQIKEVVDAVQLIDKAPSAAQDALGVFSGLDAGVGPCRCRERDGGLCHRCRRGAVHGLDNRLGRRPRRRLVGSRQGRRRAARVGRVQRRFGCGRDLGHRSRRRRVRRHRSGPWTLRRSTGRERDHGHGQRGHDRRSR